MSVHKDSRTGLYYVKHQNKTYRGFEKKSDAKNYESRLQLNEIDQISNLSISTLANDFLEDYKLNRTITTYISTKAIINNYIIKFFGNKRVQKITELDCRNFKNYLSKTNLSSKTKNHILSVLKMVFHHAKVYYKINEDPTYVIEPFNKTFEEKIAQRQRGKNIWTNEEFCKFIECVERPDYKMFFIIMYYTGLRIGEMQALKWEDYENGYITVNKEFNERTEVHHGELKEPKTANSYRDVALGHNIDKLLSDYKESQRKKYGYIDNNWFIFGRVDVFHRTTINRIKEQSIKLAGVKYITNHQFRHSHASNLICNSDTNIVAVSQRLGHSDTSITLSTYTHLLPKMEEKVSSYIDEVSSELVQNIDFSENTFFEKSSPNLLPKKNTLIK